MKKISKICFMLLIGFTSCVSYNDTEDIQLATNEPENSQLEECIKKFYAESDTKRTRNSESEIFFNEISKRYYNKEDGSLIAYSKTRSENQDSQFCISTAKFNINGNPGFCLVAEYNGKVAHRLRVI